MWHQDVPVIMYYIYHLKGQEPENKPKELSKQKKEEMSRILKELDWENTIMLDVFGTDWKL